MGKVDEGVKLENNEHREGVERVEERKNEGKERETNKEARQRNKSKDKKGGGGRTAKNEKQSEEIPRLAIEDEQPEQLLLEITETTNNKKKRKKTVKKTANKVKDELKLALVGAYGLLAVTLDDCFYLKPNEADILAEAIYRYLDEHDLIHTISEKSATLNLIVALITVNTPKILIYYRNLKDKNKEGKGDDKKGEARISNRESVDRVSRGEHINNNVKTHLNEFYIADE